VRDGHVLSGATGDKYRIMRDTQLDIRARGSDFLDRKDLPLLPEWEEQLKKIEELQLQKQQKEILNMREAPAPTSPDNNAAPGASAP
jgi:general secretion pathway protein D